MEFLKAIYGDKALTYEEFVQAINAHNGNEANKENQIKIGNLGTGEYVGKGKYDALQELVNGKETELKSANDLIAELKKASKGNEDMQKKFTDYEAANVKLQEELQETKVKYAFDVLLMDAGVTDKDEREFLAYKYQKKLKEEGKSLELDENEHIKGGEGIIDSLKTTNPKPFEKAGGKQKKMDASVETPGSDGDGDAVTKEAFDKMGYKSRVELKASNPELYAKLSN